MACNLLPDALGMAFQFVHLETYARKTDKHGRSVGYVLDEAERMPGATPHVDKPRPPEVVAGMPLAELRALHGERAGAAMTTDAKGKSKRVRVDQHTLATVVASHPGGTEEEVARWEALTVAWLRESYGDALATVVRHVDEGHPHLHAYVLPDGEMRARAFHPGVQAKDSARSEATAAGEDGKAANRRGDVAYKAAMRGWQDSYWERVGLPCGLARLGPARRRLTRAGWQAEQHQVRTAASLMDKVERLEVTATRAEAAVGRGKAVVAALHDQVAQAKAERDAAVQAAEVAKREADQMVAEVRRSATGLVAKAKREARAIVARARKEADRLKGLGAALGGFVQGIFASSPSKIEALVRAEERERAAEQVLAVRVELKSVRAELRSSEKTCMELIGTVREVATERDALRAHPSRTANRGVRLAAPR